MDETDYKLTLEEHRILGSALKKLSILLEHRIGINLRCIPVVGDTKQIDHDVSLLRSMGHMRKDLDTMLSQEYTCISPVNNIYTGDELNESAWSLKVKEE